MERLRIEAISFIARVTGMRTTSRAGAGFCEVAILLSRASGRNYWPRKFHANNRRPSDAAQRSQSKIEVVANIELVQAGATNPGKSRTADLPGESAIAVGTGNSREPQIVTSDLPPAGDNTCDRRARLRVPH